MISETEALVKLSAASKSVKEQLKKRGVIVPIKTTYGVLMGDIKVVKTDLGYNVLNKIGDVVYNNLYFIQTAIVVANALALNQSVKKSLIEDDAKAGANEFDLTMYKQRLKTALKRGDDFKVGHYQTRATESQLHYKKHINPIETAYFSLVNAVKTSAPSNKYS